MLACDMTDEDNSLVNPTVPSSTAGISKDGPIATSKPIDYDAEKKAIQQVYSEFYRAFNDKNMRDLRKTWYANTGSEFAVVWVVGGFNEQVGPSNSWANVRTTIESLWSGQGTSDKKWGNNDRLSEFWIRKKKTNAKEIEASAKGYNCFRPGAPGETLVYLVKQKDKWLIQQIDSVAQASLPSRRGQPLISKYFTGSKYKVE